MRRFLIVALFAFALTGCRSGTSADVNGMPTNTSATHAVSLDVVHGSTAVPVCCVTGAHAMGDRPGDWMVMLTLDDKGVTAFKAALSEPGPFSLSLEGEVIMAAVKASDLDGDMLTVPNLTQATAQALVTQLTR